MKKRELLSLPFLHDFYDYYYERDEKRFTEYYRNNTVLSSDDFIDYLLWNARKMNGLYVKDGKSSKSKNRFYQISKSNWIPKQHIKDKKGTDIELSIHLESASNDRAVLHFETDPYIKFRGLKQKFGEKFLDEYIRMRNSYRKHFADRTEKLADSYHLTLARFKLPKKIGCNDRIKELFELIAYIDDAFV